MTSENAPPGAKAEIRSMIDPEFQIDASRIATQIKAFVAAEGLRGTQLAALAMATHAAREVDDVEARAALHGAIGLAIEVVHDVDASDGLRVVVMAHDALVLIEKVCEVWRGLSGATGAYQVATMVYFAVRADWPLYADALASFAEATGESDTTGFLSLAPW